MNGSCCCSSLLFSLSSLNLLGLSLLFSLFPCPAREVLSWLRPGNIPKNSCFNKPRRREGQKRERRETCRRDGGYLSRHPPQENHHTAIVDASSHYAAAAAALSHRVARIPYKVNGSPFAILAHPVTQMVPFVTERVN